MCYGIRGQRVQYTTRCGMEFERSTVQFMMWVGIRVQTVQYSTVHYMMWYGIRVQMVQYRTVHDVICN